MQNIIKNIPIFNIVRFFNIFKFRSTFKKLYAKYQNCECDSILSLQFIFIYYNLRMKHIKENNSFILTNNDSTKVITQNSQTEKLREQTNKSIKELGNRYYHVKQILERINIRRDVLYDIGKKLEEEYEKIKRIIPL